MARGQRVGDPAGDGSEKPVTPISEKEYDIGDFRSRRYEPPR